VSAILYRNFDKPSFERVPDNNTNINKIYINMCKTLEIAFPDNLLDIVNK
tara:strand:+ start:596 stop:745 length:150 start_codon:yes stop_codon:yes gene_type:complete